MRQVGDFVYFTKSEECEIFHCYYEALGKAKMDSHRDNLKLVNYVIGDTDGTHVLLKDVWKFFCTNLMELEIDTTTFLEVLKEDPKYPARGNCYRIPSYDKDPLGHMKAINRRRKWRARFRDLAKDAASTAVVYDMTVSEYRKKGNGTWDRLVRDHAARKRRAELRLVEGGVE